jgi:hypothetical protein
VIADLFAATAACKELLTGGIGVQEEFFSKTKTLDLLASLALL